MPQYAAQGVGFIGMLLVFLAFQKNDKGKILRFQACAGAAFAIHFLLLGGYTGACMNLIEIGRNLVFVSYVGQKRKRMWVFLFAATFAGIGALSWESAYSLLPIFAMVLSTFALSLDDPRRIRYLCIPVSLGWIVYNVHTLSIAGALTEAFALTSLVIAMVRFDFPLARKL